MHKKVYANIVNTVNIANIKDTFHSNGWNFAS